MKRRAFHLACFWTCLGIVAPGFAQQGHPLTGTWNGDWGLSATQRNHVTFVMKWDGQKIAGVVNPGPGSAPIGTVVMDPGTWAVRIEADLKDPSGAPVHIMAEGKLDDIGGYHRSITGTWHQGTAKGDFKVTRD